jgi:membrane associated rhomboid family serine protease
MTGVPPEVEEFDLPLPEGIDHCYRHPFRETGVHCSNCGRPVCHECMTPAPVGFRCPECMAEQRRTGGRARVVTRQQTRSRWQGGMMGSGGMSVTKVLVGINVVVFLIEVLVGAVGMGGGGSTAKLVDMGALVPALVASQHEYWRLFASIFLHGGVFHLLFNMWALLVVGDYLESAIGKVKFVAVYLVAGFGGSVFVMLLSHPWTPTVGASGAIFGLFAALAVYAYLNRNHDLAARMLLRQMLFIIGINVVISVMGSGYISWQGHGGGLVAGTAAMAALTVFGRKDARDPWGVPDGGLLLAEVVVLLVLLLWRVQTMLV